jgi:hypothetical protein
MKNLEASNDLLFTTKGQLAGDRVRLQRLWARVQHTYIVVEQAVAAYVESRKMLDRIDGSPSAAVRAEIRIPA